MVVLKSNKGFTIVEVLISVVLIAIGLIGAISLISSSLRGFAITAGELSEIAIAQGEIEQFINQRASISDWDADGKKIFTSGNGLMTIHLYDWKK